MHISGYLFVPVIHSISLLLILHPNPTTPLNELNKHINNSLEKIKHKKPKGGLKGVLNEGVGLFKEACPISVH